MRRYQYSPINDATERSPIVWALLVAVVILSVVSTLAHGAGAVTMTGPTEVEAGKGAIVKIPREEAGAEYSLLVEPASVGWIYGENAGEVFAVLIDLDPGIYVVSFVSFDRKTHATHKIEAVGPGPEPRPPDPDPEPVDPDIPDVPLPGKYGLTKQAIKIVTDAKLDKPTATLIAANYSDVVKKLREGVYLLLQAPIDEIRRENQTDLANRANKAEWTQALNMVGAAAKAVEPNPLGQD